MSADETTPIISRPTSPARTGILIVSAAALAMAVTGGVVFGFVWGGGGPPAVAEAPPPAAQLAAAPAPALVGASGAYLPSLADIVERVSPAVVSLRVKVTIDQAEVDEEDLENLPPALRDFWERFRRNGPNRRPRGEIQGSGFVIDPTGYLVTNNHVVANSTDIEVRFADGKNYKAKKIGADELTDVALLKVDAGRSLPAVRFGDDTKVRVGDWVLAVGNPFGLGGSVTAGIVSARGRDEVAGAQYTDYLQIDAAINRGNSGGPTFDMNGRVIGMNTAIFSPSGGSVGIGFAIPSTTIQKIVEELKRSGTITRGWLGVQIQSLTQDSAQALGLPDDKGAIVAEVIDGSPAQKAGFKQGDVVLRMNGATIKDNRDLSRKVAALQVGQSASFVVWRDNREINITVTIAKRPDEERISGLDNPRGGSKDAGSKDKTELADLGLELAVITPAVRTEFDLDKAVSGVLITDVDPDSDAAEQGLRAGDRIIGIGNDQVRTLSDIRAGVAEAKSKSRPSVLLFVENQRGQKRYVPVKMNKG